MNRHRNSWRVRRRPGDWAWGPSMPWLLERWAWGSWRLVSAHDAHAAAMRVGDELARRGRRT